MPIAQIHLVRGAFDDAAIGAALLEASAHYARTLYPDAAVPPIERVRVFVHQVEPQLWAAGGKLATQGGAVAPFFTCLAMTGRTMAQHHALLAGFTEILARHLGCDAALIRGQVVPVEPDNWGIGGVPASLARQAEIAARAAG
ncbi:MAG: hypothetical protein RIS85_91 [Pseudomonadota bacterium]|jgi:phenylpyruvate tautomerase PptA (4-oxalocrotonate tautomerase family)